jgi:hypothetical protein
MTARFRKKNTDPPWLETSSRWWANGRWLKIRAAKVSPSTADCPIMSQTNSRRSSSDTRNSELASAESPVPTSKMSAPVLMTPPYAPVCRSSLWSIKMRATEPAMPRSISAR